MQTITKVILAGLFFLAILKLSAAPVPAYKAKPRLPLCGERWVMKWGYVSIPDNVFTPDGGYRCQSRWLGRWKLDGDTLRIQWWCVDEQDRLPYEDVITLLPGKWEGAFGEYKREFKLTRE